MASGNVRLPINVIGLQAFAMSFEPRLDQAGNVRKDKSGADQWVVHCTVLVPEQSKPQNWSITVAGEPKGLATAMPVHIKDLMVSDWEMEGRQGLSFKASSVTPVTNSHPAPAAVKS
jgi:hypothetical protein